MYFCHVKAIIGHKTKFITQSGTTKAAHKMEKSKLIVYMSGSKSSAYMSWWLKGSMGHKYEMVFVFCNTGRERKETLDFLHACDSAWGLDLVWLEANVSVYEKAGIRANVVSYETAARGGEPFEAFISKYGIPNHLYPYCGNSLKALVVLDFARQIGWVDMDTNKKLYELAVDIRVDEPKRMSASAERVKKSNPVVYPLRTMMPVVKADIDEFWSKQDFGLSLKSYECGGCDLCWKRDPSKTMTIIADNPELVDWWADMPKKYGDSGLAARKNNPNSIFPAYFYRYNTPIEDIVAEMSKGYTRAKDDTELYAGKTWVEESNINGGCWDSCEPF